MILVLSFNLVVEPFFRIINPIMVVLGNLLSSRTFLSLAGPEKHVLRIRDDEPFSLLEILIF